MAQAVDPAEPAATASGGEAAPDPVCRCGHTACHYMVSPEPTYTTWGKFCVIFLGVSTPPIRVDFRCRICKVLISSTEDPSEMKRRL